MRKYAAVWMVLLWHKPYKIFVSQMKNVKGAGFREKSLWFLGLSSIFNFLAGRE